MTQFFKNIVVSEAYWFFMSVLLISFAYPSPPITTISFIGVCFFSLIFNFQKGEPSTIKNKALLFLILLFFVTQLVTHWVIDQSLFSEKLFKLLQLPMLVFAIYFGPQLTFPIRDRLLAYFSYSVTLFSFLGLLKVSYLYQQGMVSQVSYLIYAEQLGVLSTYFALMVCLAIVFFLHSYFNSLSVKKSVFYLMITGFLISVLLLLAVRVSLLALLITFVFFFLYYHKKVKKISIVILLTAIAFSLILITNSDYIITRIINLTQVGNSAEISDLSNRLILWKCTWQTYLHKANWMFGIGILHFQELLNQCYLENNITHAFDQNYNTHNQYLQFLLNTGLFGFLSWLSLMVYLLFKAIRHKAIQMIMFVVIFLIFSITESVFEKSLAILIFGIFISLNVSKFNSEEKLD